VQSAGRGQLDGLHALVVGGSSGLGFATTRLLARDGAHVTIAGRDQQRLDDAVARFSSDGHAVAACACDVNKAADVRAAIAAACDDGRLDIAVCVPGGGSYARVTEYDDDAFGAQIDRNVRPVFLMLKYAVPAMTNGGSFIAVSSTAAAFSTRYLAAYSAGKAAVDALVRVAADELGERNIRVNSVRPGLTRTASTVGLFADEAITARFLDGQPLARGGEAEDVAQAIRYLAGPESSWVTGQHLAVDGGHTLRAFPDMGDLVRPPKPKE
jgi:NAD(P)-dependent dehydrogenase (short-subunit alcohol dehydrogenase family)